MVRGTCVEVIIVSWLVGPRQSPLDFCRKNILRSIIPSQSSPMLFLGREHILKGGTYAENSSLNSSFIFKFRNNGRDDSVNIGSGVFDSYYTASCVSMHLPRKPRIRQRNVKLEHPRHTFEWFNLRLFGFQHRRRTLYGHHCPSGV